MIYFFLFCGFQWFKRPYLYLPLLLFRLEFPRSLWSSFEIGYMVLSAMTMKRIFRESNYRFVSKKRLGIYKIVFSFYSDETEQFSLEFNDWFWNHFPQSVCDLEKIEKPKIGLSKYRKIRAILYNRKTAHQIEAGFTLSNGIKGAENTTDWHHPRSYHRFRDIRFQFRSVRLMWKTVFLAFMSSTHTYEALQVLNI